MFCTRAIKMELFILENSENIEKENPNWSCSQVFEHLIENWYKLPVSEKRNYQKRLNQTKKEEINGENIESDEDYSITPQNPVITVNNYNLNELNSKVDQISYSYFINKHENEVMEKHPEWNPIQIARELSNMWQHLSENEKIENEKQAIKNHQPIKIKAPKQTELVLKTIENDNFNISRQNREIQTEKQSTFLDSFKNGFVFRLSNAFKSINSPKNNKFLIIFLGILLILLFIILGTILYAGEFKTLFLKL